MKNKSFDIPLMVLFGAFVVASGMFVFSSVNQLNSTYKDVASKASVTSQLAQAGGGGNSTDLSGYAWSSNTGWISFNSANSGAGGGDYRVSISTTTQTPSGGKFDGYAWSSNVGWISFQSSDVSGCPVADAVYDRPASIGGNGAPLPYGTSDICTPRVDLSASGTTGGIVSGWARILSMKAENGEGWLHLSGTNHPSGSGGVNYNSGTGSFTGYAWEPSSIGWVSFDLTLSTIPASPPPSLVGGSCSIVAPTTVNVASGGTHTFNVTSDLTGMSGGTGPYFVTGPTSFILGAGVWPLTVNVSDSANPANTKTLSCGNVSVTETPVSMPLGLYIGSTPTSARLAPSTNPFGIRQGNKFALRWENSLDPEYSCVATVVNNSSGSTVNFWPLWDGSNVDDPGELPGQTTSSSDGVLRGVYRFRVGCTAATFPPQSVEAYLRVVGVSGEEF